MSLIKFILIIFTIFSLIFLTISRCEADLIKGILLGALIAQKSYKPEFIPYPVFPFFGGEQFLKKIADHLMEKSTPKPTQHENYYPEVYVTEYATIHPESESQGQPERQTNQEPESQPDYPTTTTTEATTTTTTTTKSSKSEEKLYKNYHNHLSKNRYQIYDKKTYLPHQLTVMMSRKSVNHGKIEDQADSDWGFSDYSKKKIIFTDPDNYDVNSSSKINLTIGH